MNPRVSTKKVFLRRARKVYAPKSCAHCMKSFMPPQNSYYKAKYCTFACGAAATRYTPEQRVAAFWRLVDKSGRCWIFQGGKDIWGYGRFAIGNNGGRSRLGAAHRFSYELANGPIENDLLVLHSCDNPPCVNPAHLRLGTNKDNSADKMTRRPHKAITRAKITEDQVRYIRDNYRKVSPRRGNGAALARELGVSSSVVHNIGSGRTWTHVK
jgi:hypothetical protein